jgi:hypothetical protein
MYRASRPGFHRAQRGEGRGGAAVQCRCGGAVPVRWCTAGAVVQCQCGGAVPVRWCSAGAVVQCRCGGAVPVRWCSAGAVVQCRCGGAVPVRWCCAGAMRRCGSDRGRGSLGGPSSGSAAGAGSYTALRLGQLSEPSMGASRSFGKRRTMAASVGMLTGDVKASAVAREGASHIARLRSVQPPRPRVRASLQIVSRQAAASERPGGSSVARPPHRSVAAVVSRQAAASEHHGGSSVARPPHRSITADRQSPRRRIRASPLRTCQ